MFKRFGKGKSQEQDAQPATQLQPRPQLELSGPQLEQALKSMLDCCEMGGGAERYVEALQFKSSIFKDAFKDGLEELTLPRFLKLCMFMPTVRRKACDYFKPETYGAVADALPTLLDTEISPADRLSAFQAAFPDDRGHRWVRDLGTEILHNLDPERFPVMMRWVWDMGTNTGVIREIWHADDIDHIIIELPDNYETFLVLREELAGYLSENGVFRDVPWYVDLLCGHIYARYLAAQGGTLLRTDFGATEQDLGLHTRRILGLDGVRAKGDLGRDPDRLALDNEITKQLSLIQEG